MLILKKLIIVQLLALSFTALMLFAEQQEYDQLSMHHIF